MRRFIVGVVGSLLACVVGYLAPAAYAQVCPPGYILMCQPITSPTGNNTQPDTPPPRSPSDDVTALHNKYRAKHQVSPLNWSSALEQDAIAWAAGCRFMHSGTPGQGENLFAISRPLPEWPDVAAQAIKIWYDEMIYYNFGAPGFSPSTGHATQMLWAATQQVGCAVQNCVNGMSMGWGPESVFVVCRYSPPGNVIGAFPQNVLPATA